MDPASEYRARAASALIEASQLDQRAARAGSDRARRYFTREAHAAEYRAQILSTQAKRADASEQIAAQLEQAREWTQRETGWTVLSPTAERTARKYHPCDDCGRDIPPGELYTTTTYRSPEGLTTWRTCPHCGDGRTIQNASTESTERQRRGGVSER